MPYIPLVSTIRDWKNRREALTTPLSAENVEDLEQRSRDDTRAVAADLWTQIFDVIEVTSDTSTPSDLDPGRIHITVDGSGTPTHLWFGTED